MTKALIESRTPPAPQIVTRAARLLLAGNYEPSRHLYLLFPFEYHEAVSIGVTDDEFPVSPGLILRKPNPDDRRGTLITLVRSGQEKVAPLFKSAWAAQNTLVGSYSDEELLLLAGFFERATEMWEEEGEKVQQK